VSGLGRARALVRHVVRQDLRNFLDSVQGRAADWQAPADELGADWAAEFRTGAERLLEAWRLADLDELVAMPGGARTPLRGRADMQIAELATHCWDLAKATGQRAALDPVLAEHALGWSKQMLRPEFRGPDKAFGMEVTLPPGAPAYDRLARVVRPGTGLVAARVIEMAACSIMFRVSAPACAPAQSSTTRSWPCSAGGAGHGPSTTTATARSVATRDGNNVEAVRHAPEPGDVITDGFESRH